MSKNYKKSVSPEDQAQINEFARVHKNLVDLKYELKSLEKEKANYNDANDELVILDDSDGPFAYKFGESFIYMNHEDIVEKIEKSVATIDKEFERLKVQIEHSTKQRDALKEQLRNKFGDNIGLDDDEES